MKENVIARAALILAVLSLIANAIALGTISEQQSRIEGLESDFDVLVSVWGTNYDMDTEVFNALAERGRQVDSIQAILDGHEQILDGLVQNDADITDILNRLVPLVEQSH